MKNKMKFLGIIALVAIIGFSMAACPTGGGGGGGGNTAGSITYTGESGGSTYSLKITENTGRAVYTPKNGDSYELTVPGKKKPNIVNIAKTTISKLLFVFISSPLVNYFSE
jgi:hypothetical protein